MKWWFYIGNVLLVAVLVGCNTPPPVGHPLNSYQSKQERDEQKGFQAILEGLCNMFRNPESHQPKIEWPISEQDALEILSLISYCHRRLDRARKYSE